MQYITAQYNTINYNTIQCIQYNTIQHNVMQNNTKQYKQFNTIQCNTMQYNTIQYKAYNKIQYNVIQYNTIQFNAIQYIILVTQWLTGLYYATWMGMLRNLKFHSTFRLSNSHLYVLASALNMVLKVHNCNQRKQAWDHLTGCPQQTNARQVTYIHQVIWTKTTTFHTGWLHRQADGGNHGGCTGGDLAPRTCMCGYLHHRHRVSKVEPV